MAELVDQIEAMIRQEGCAYATYNYLAPSFQQSLSSHYLEDSFNDGMAYSDSSSTGITEMWREKICEWSYQVIDHFDFSREVVAIAMNYLDRYLATKIVNKKVFQLAAMTALFLAVKLHEPSKLSMASMIELSRGCFTVPQMTSMEASLFLGLRWHLHPPTAHSFTKRFLHMVPLRSIPVEVLYDVLELSRFFTELSVIDYFFVTQRPSHVAAASIANAMQGIAIVSAEAQYEFIDMMRRNHNIDLERSHEIIECRNRLRLLSALQGNLGTGVNYGNSGSAAFRGGDTSSPVSVSYDTINYQGYPISRDNTNAVYQREIVQGASTVNYDVHSKQEDHSLTVNNSN
eukprot:CAMPEP_0198147810 /NCGR_PEP_ID=MMETSP1443-20131203/37897_1 /TAXON_ID=186043 /ORGANISM="Entomoneis sp., Strain CCMP2396" /LENGTH=344 /DNA_ID=CAMNT_0043812297 /DNA_START=204 /DNA_END=1238 /DNA_ORIENTATION=+